MSHLAQFEKALNRVPLEQNESMYQSPHLSLRILRYLKDTKGYKLSAKYLDDEVDWDAFAAMNRDQEWT